jgi:hypothetical protein
MRRLSVKILASHLPRASIPPLNQHRVAKPSDPLEVDPETIVDLRESREETLEDGLRPHECLARP